MTIDPTYNNPATMREKAEALRNDRAQHTTYHQRARDSLGAEMGRWSHLSKEQQLVGTAPSPYPRQSGYWAEADNAVEPPLGYRIDEMAPPEGFNPPEVAPELPKTVEVEVLTAKGFRRRI
jgi:hypothetical protein